MEEPRRWICTIELTTFPEAIHDISCCSHPEGMVLAVACQKSIISWFIDLREMKLRPGIIAVTGEQQEEIGGIHLAKAKTKDSGCVLTYGTSTGRVAQRMLARKKTDEAIEVTR